MIKQVTAVVRAIEIFIKFVDSRKKEGVTCRLFLHYRCDSPRVKAIERTKWNISPFDVWRDTPSQLNRSMQIGGQSGANRGPIGGKSMEQVLISQPAGQQVWGSSTAVFLPQLSSFPNSHPGQANWTGSVQTPSDPKAQIGQRLRRLFFRKSNKKAACPDIKLSKTYGLMGAEGLEPPTLSV